MDNYTDQNEQPINIKEEIQKYFQHWRWFILSLFLFIVLALIYLRYTASIYEAQATVLVKDEKNSSLQSQLSAFSEMGLFSGSGSIENEIEIFKSRTLSEKTIDSLHLNISYFSNGQIKKLDLYKNSPFIVTNLAIDKQINTLDFPISFLIKIKNQSFVLETDDESIGTFAFGQNISFKGIRFQIIKSNPDILIDESNSYLFNINTISNTAREYLKSFNIDATSKTSSILKLSFTSINSEKAVDYLNGLIAIYNEQSIADKRYISKNTSEFISNRLDIIATELGDVEKQVENYKKTNELSDITTEVKLSLENLNDFQKSVIENEVQIKVVNDMISHLKSSKSFDLLPSNYLNDNSLINETNKLILERNKLQNSGALAENPNLIKLEEQIKSLKSNILTSLKQQAVNLTIIKNDFKKKENELNSKISMVPRQEREFRIIDRQQKVKEALYLFLLQKREETNISIAATELNAKVIDQAIPNEKPISPKKLLILLAACILGLLFPFAIIYIINLLDTKIKSRLDLEGKIPIPFLGDVPTSESHEQLIELNSRSSSAEAIRIIRTNIEFILPQKENEAKIIFSTSTFSGEGKTFISANLAATIALSGKKVLLMGMDLRNPKLKEYINLPVIGITNFLTNKDAKIQDYIIKIDGYEDFYALPAGTIPPNPAELLMNKKIEEMFKTLKQQYDYIIVDTAPVSLVTDTLLIAKYADAFIYVIRANKLDKKLLNIPVSLYKENKLPNMSLLLNDTDSTKGYGYGYGYGKLKENANRPLWKKILGIK